MLSDLNIGLLYICIYNLLFFRLAKLLISGLQAHPIASSQRESGLLGEAVLFAVKATLGEAGKGGLLDWVRILWRAGVRNPSLASLFEQVNDFNTVMIY